jgi:hypothetical protein
VSAAKKDQRLVIEGAFLRGRKGKAVAFAVAPPVAPPRTKRPAHVARMLALAHHLQKAIDDGAVADRAAVARKLGLTRARVTQLLDLLLLAPDLQLAVLAMEAIDGVEPSSERPLRRIAHEPIWGRQVEQFRNVID